MSSDSDISYGPKEGHQPFNIPVHTFSTTATTTVPVIVSTSSQIPREQKTSVSHPINISWIVPPDVLTYLTFQSFPAYQDLYDFLQSEFRGFCRHYIEKQQIKSSPKGNLCLSSCPGKKVRLSGPVRGRATINRDLDLDFHRIKSFGITMIVCCLGDSELEFLGAPWPIYEKKAKSHDLEIVRLPMVEGGCPSSINELRQVVLRANEEINKGNNVLAHCRGGVGRAGLFAGCWLLENMLCKTAERTLYVLRDRRSSKAIETLTQAEFLVRYSMSVNQRYGIPRFPGPYITNFRELPPEIGSNGSPSIRLVAKLENMDQFDLSSPVVSSSVPELYY